MGNSQVKVGHEPRMLLTEYNGLAYRDLLGSYKLFKVMQCVHEREGLVVVKLFIYRPGAPDLADIQWKVNQYKAIFSIDWLYPNVIPYQGMEIAYRSAVLLRHYFQRNLHDRMHTRPFLSDETRNWIAFQVLCGVSQAHSAGIFHGDLKTENIFVSSWDHVFISDFAWFKPLYLPEDDPSEFSFFFEANLNRRRCYLAPERFDAGPKRAVENSGDSFSLGFTPELEAMDVFSLGCVLAELFLDGQTLLDLPKLLLYRSGQLDLSGKLAGIRNPAARALVTSMLSRDPSSRRPAVEYLSEWMLRVAPRSYRTCLFPLSVLLMHPVYQQPDMRVLLLRHNFASILWAVVGPRAINAALSVATPRRAEGCEDETFSEEAWQQFVERRLRSMDEATLHVAVHAAVQAASQWGESSAAAASDIALAGSHGGSFGVNASSSSKARMQSSSASSGLDGSQQQDKEGRHRKNTLLHRSSASADSTAGSGGTSGADAAGLVQPLLNRSSCERFAQELFERWGEGRRRALDQREAHSQDAECDASPDIYAAFLAELCGQPNVSGGGFSCAEEESEEVASSSILPMPGDRTAGRVDNVLSIVIGTICSCVFNLSSPRMRTICLDMFELMAPFASQCALLEQLIPFTHQLMTDHVAKVRARAVDVLAVLLIHVRELPSSDAHLFLEYIFPQLLSAMSGVGNEPVALLAIARNLGPVARHALRFAELSAAAAQRVALETQAAMGGVGVNTEPVAESQQSPELSFDAHAKQVREAVQKLVRQLIECIPAGGSQSADIPSSHPDSELSASGGPQATEEARLQLAMGREIKLALLRNMHDLAEVFGREGTHNFLLPYVITFMNDASWEVRSEFVEQAAYLPRKVGQVTTEGIIWPCYDQALLDQEERVLKGALSGLAVLISQSVLQRDSLVKVAQKTAPLLVHPSEAVRARSLVVFEHLESQVSVVDQYVFLVPVIRPFTRFEISNLKGLEKKLVPPLPRRLYTHLIHKDEVLYDAVLRRKPLPSQLSYRQKPPSGSGCDEAAAICEIEQSEAGDENAEDECADANDLKALDLLRPFLQPLLQSRRSGSSAASLRDDVAALVAVVSPALLQNVQYFLVNPLCASNRSLQALQEADGGRIGPALLPEQLAGGGTSTFKRHPLELFSMRAFLAQALCLPPRRPDIGSLSYQTGMPYSIYAAADAARRDAALAAQAGDLSVTPAELIGVGAMEASYSSVLRNPSTGSVDIVGLPSVAAMAGINPLACERTSFGASPRGLAVTGAAVSSSAVWKPRGMLLATLYEYAHQSGVPVVKVDTTDDSRILVTGGKDGVVKIWNCAALERDVAVGSSHTFVACGSKADVMVPRRGQRLRALRTIRDSKSVAVGCETGDVALYKIEPSRGGPRAAEICRLESGETHGSCAITCMEQFDTELESLLVFAQQHGPVRGWDVRSASHCWSVSDSPPYLGSPSCIAAGDDGHSIVVGTLAGGLLLYDLRFLAPWKHWRVSSGAPILSLRCADCGVSPGVFAALGGDCNEVAFFDVVRGSCVTLFLTESVSDKQRDASISVPSLSSVPTTRGESSALLRLDQFEAGFSGAGRFASGCVRALHMPRGASYLLAAGADRKVRHWSLDPERHAAEAYVVTPHDPLAPTDAFRTRPYYSSSHVGGTFVVQEQTLSGQLGSKQPGVSSEALGNQQGDESGPNQNHRDAILDMCTISLQHDILVTAGRDGLVKLWK